MKKTKARYIGDWDPEYTPGEIYKICPLKDTVKGFPPGSLIGAYNAYGEAYVMPAALFEVLPPEEAGEEEEAIEVKQNDKVLLKKR